MESFLFISVSYAEKLAERHTIDRVRCFRSVQNVLQTDYLFFQRNDVHDVKHTVYRAEEK